MDKVLFICDKYKDYCHGYHGHAVRVSSIVDCFKAQGVKCYILLLGEYIDNNYGYEEEIINFSNAFKSENIISYRQYFHYCIEFLLNNNVDVVFSSSPPLMAHQLASELKDHAGSRLKWIMDIRDLTSRHPYLSKTDQDVIRNELLESALACRADVCTVVSGGMEDELNSILCKHKTLPLESLHVIENGFNDVDVIVPDNALVKFKEENKDRVLFIYSGSGVLDERGGNKNLYKLMSAIERNPKAYSNAAVVLQGEILVDEELLASFRKKFNILMLPSQSYDHARANMALCDIGININVNSSHASQIVGGKTYDYIASNIGLFMIFPDQAKSIKNICQKLNGKPFFANVDSDIDIDEKLLSIISCKDHIDDYKVSVEEAYFYSRKLQNNKLFEIIENANSRDNNAQADFYDSAYKKGGYNQEYLKRFYETEYFFPWSVVVNIIKKELNDFSFLDIGCGPGQFAEMCFENGIINYSGIDLSKIAIEMAKKNNPSHAEKFIHLDVNKKNINFGDFDAFIALEVLEHIYDDLSLVSGLPSGKNVIFSVPNYDSKTHVRVFKNPEEIINRYSRLINIDNIFECHMQGGKIIYIFIGVTKEGEFK